MKKRLNHRKRQKAKVLLLFLTVTFLFTFINIHSSNLSNPSLRISSEAKENIENNNDILIYNKTQGYNFELEILYIQFSGGTQSQNDNNLLLFGITSLGTIFILEFSVVIKKITKKGAESNEEIGYSIEDSDYLVKEEGLILELVKNYLENNSYFDKEKLVQFINSRVARNGLNLNTNGVMVVLNSLIKKNIVAEGSKLTREEVLLNSNRRSIYKYINENPGTYSNRIVNSLNLSTFLVNWHLDMLLKFDFIRKEKIDNIDAFYDVNTNPEYDEVIHIISRDKCSIIIEYLKENRDGCTKYKITKELGLHPNTVTKYINKLVDFGLLIDKNSSNKVLYCLNEINYSNLNYSP